MPALETSTSTPPKRSTQAATPWSTCFSSVTSICTARPAMESATACAGASCTSATQTRAPSRAKASAMSRPMPLAAPVTIATLSFIRMAQLPLAEQRSHHAAPEEENRQDEDQAGDHADRAGVGGERVAQQEHDGRAHRRPEQRAGAAEERHHHH